MPNKKDTLLWQITDPESGHISYIFGTIHVWETRFQPIFDAVLPYLESCRQFAAESHLAEMREVNSDAFLLPSPLKLPDFYTSKKYERLSKKVQGIMHCDISAFEHLTPFVLLSNISNILVEKESDESIDEKLWQFAASIEKELFGVESVEEQYSYYQRMPFEDQAAQLLGIVKNAQKYRQNLRKMVERYLKQDIRQLYQNSKKGIKSFRKMMIYDRNEIMSARISDFAKRNSIFVAIGAGHLAGQKGVLRQLKKEGFLLKPVKI